MNFFAPPPSNQVFKASLLLPLLHTCTHKHAQAFVAYHRTCPGIYAEFCKFAEKMRTAGRAYYSVETVINVLRWHRDIQTPSDEPFKINNNHKSFYARMYMHHYDCPQFFRCRESYADDIEFPAAHRGILVGRLPEAS